MRSYFLVSVKWKFNKKVYICGFQQDKSTFTLVLDGKLTLTSVYFAKWNKELLGLRIVLSFLTWFVYK